MALAMDTACPSLEIVTSCKIGVVIFFVEFQSLGLLCVQ